MIQTIGYIVSVYCVVRLIQAPMALPDGTKTWGATLFFSVVGVAAILFLAWLLSTQGLDPRLLPR